MVFFPGEKSESLNSKKVGGGGDINEEKDKTQGPRFESRKDTLQGNGMEGNPAK